MMLAHRFLRIHLLARSISLSSAKSARGGGTRRPVRKDEELVEKPLPEDFPTLGRDAFRQPRSPFDMDKFTSAVRGDLEPDEEERYFRQQTPQWMQDRSETSTRMDTAARGADSQEFRHIGRRKAPSPQQQQTASRNASQVVSDETGDDEARMPQRRKATHRPIHHRAPEPEDVEEAHVADHKKRLGPQLTTSVNAASDDQLRGFDATLGEKKSNSRQKKTSSDEDIITKLRGMSADRGGPRWGSKSPAPNRTGALADEMMDEEGDDEVEEHNPVHKKPASSGKKTVWNDKKLRTEEIPAQMPDYPSQQSRRDGGHFSKGVNKSRKYADVSEKYQKMNTAFSDFQYADDPTQSSRPSSRSDFETSSAEPAEPAARKKRDRNSGMRHPSFDEDAEEGADDTGKLDHSQQENPAKSKTFTKKSKDVYHALGDEDPTFKNNIIAVKSRKDRLKNRKILLEGVRLIKDALENSIPITKIFATRKELMDEISGEHLDAANPELYLVSSKAMRMWSDMTTPPGIVAVAGIPNVDAVAFGAREGSMPLTVILDNIRDPGNMGAIVRVLAGAGCSQLLAIRDCVDPWDGKVLRAAMGGHFRLPLQYNLNWDQIDNYIDSSSKVFLADNLEEKNADPLGRLSEDNQSVKLFRKKRFVPLDLVSYNQVDLSSGDVVLVIGGETHGVSEQAYRKTKDMDGKKLIIPMAYGMESLNAASAVAVLAFEMKRQRLGRRESVPEDTENVGKENEEAPEQTEKKASCKLL